LPLTIEKALIFKGQVLENNFLKRVTQI